MRKMVNKLVIVAVVVLLGACDKEHFAKMEVANLSGKWVESEYRKDTLSFEKMVGVTLLSLSRGEQVAHEGLSAQPGSGHYLYELGDGEVSLLWILSRHSHYQAYALDIEGMQMRIGNFYDANLEETLLFEKLD